MAKGKTPTEILEEYLPIIKAVKSNISLIKDKENVDLPEYQNLYNFLFSSILLLKYPCKENEDMLEFSFDDEKYLASTDIIKGIIQDNYDKINIQKEEILTEEPVAEKETEIPEEKSEDKAIEAKDLSQEIPETSENEKKEEEVKQEETENKESEELFSDEDDFEFEDEKQEPKKKEVQKEDIIAESQVPVEEEPKKEVMQFIEDEELNCKSKQHFVLNKHKVRIEDNDGFSFDFEILVYPLEYSDMRRSPVKILAVVTKNGKSRVHFSSKEAMSKSIIVDFDDYKFYIKGSWDDKNFETNVFPQDTSFKIVESATEHISFGVVPKYFGKRIETGNGYMEFFPLNLENDVNTGCVPSVALCDIDGEESLIFPDNNGSIGIATEGRYVQFETFWTGKDYRVYDA